MHWCGRPKLPPPDRTGLSILEIKIPLPRLRRQKEIFSLPTGHSHLGCLATILSDVVCF